MGPMLAAARFLNELEQRTIKPDRIEARLYGSLAFTGKGHATDRAVLLGLLGFEPKSVSHEAAEAALEKLVTSKALEMPSGHRVRFEEERDLVFDYGPALPGHANGMKMLAEDASGLLYEATYYSIGGGFIASEQELANGHSSNMTNPNFPTIFAAQRKCWPCKASGKTIADMKQPMRLLNGAQTDANSMNYGTLWIIEAGLTQRLGG